MTPTQAAMSVSQSDDQPGRANAATGSVAAPGGGSDRLRVRRPGRAVDRPGGGGCVRGGPFRSAVPLMRVPRRGRRPARVRVSGAGDRRHPEVLVVEHRLCDPVGQREAAVDDPDLGARARPTRRAAPAPTSARERRHRPAPSSTSKARSSGAARRPAGHPTARSTAAATARARPDHGEHPWHAAAAAAASATWCAVDVVGMAVAAVGVVAQQHLRPHLVDHRPADPRPPLRDPDRQPPPGRRPLGCSADGVPAIPESR